MPSCAYEWRTVAMIHNPPMSGNSLQIEDHGSVVTVSRDDVHYVWRVAAGLAHTCNGFVPGVGDEPDNLL